MEEAFITPPEFEPISEVKVKKPRKKRPKKIKEVVEVIQSEETVTGVYISKGIVKEYTASSRASVKIPTPGGGKDTIYTFEATATMYIPEGVNPKSVNLELELKNLFDKLNGQVDDQIGDTEASLLRPQN